MNKKKIIIRNLGLLNWKTVYDKMNNFTNKRGTETKDEIWFSEHYPIFTQGQTENKNKILSIKKIPVMNSNRGGKITYHGPGQQLVYLLIDLKRLNINVHQFLFLIEDIVLNTLNFFSISGKVNRKYPGIYIKNKKICSIGLRIKRSCSLHGFSLNIDMDLKPFQYIKPCGYNFKMTQVSNIKKNIIFYKVRDVLIKYCLLYFF